jgi:hypothetical protein
MRELGSGPLKTFQNRYSAALFWVPALVAVAINPGRNAANVRSLSSPSLALLSICGVLILGHFFIGVAQPHRLSFMFSDERLSFRGALGLFFALLLGLVCMYYAWLGFTWRLS